MHLREDVDDHTLKSAGRCSRRSRAASGKTSPEVGPTRVGCRLERPTGLTYFFTQVRPPPALGGHGGRAQRTGSPPGKGRGAPVIRGRHREVGRRSPDPRRFAAPWLAAVVCRPSRDARDIRIANPERYGSDRHATLPLSCLRPPYRPRRSVDQRSYRPPAPSARP